MSDVPRASVARGLGKLEDALRILVGIEASAQPELAADNLSRAIRHLHEAQAQIDRALRLSDSERESPSP